MKLFLIFAAFLGTAMAQESPCGQFARPEVLTGKYLKMLESQVAYSRQHNAGCVGQWIGEIRWIAEGLSESIQDYHNKKSWQLHLAAAVWLAKNGSKEDMDFVQQLEAQQLWTISSYRASDNRVDIATKALDKALGKK